MIKQILFTVVALSIAATMIPITMIITAQSVVRKARRIREWLKPLTYGRKSMEQKIELTEAQLKLKAQQLLSELDSLEPNHEIGRKLFYLRNFLFNYFGRASVNDELKSENEISTDYVYVSFDNIKAL